MAGLHALAARCPAAPSLLKTAGLPRRPSQRSRASARPQAIAAPLPPAGQERQQQGTTEPGRLWRAYPHIHRGYPGLEQVHGEPPVYVAHNFLSRADCEELRRAAEAGELPKLAYDNAALLDVHRLWPLLLVVAGGAGFDAWHALADAGASAPLTADALAAAAGPALLKWSAAVGALVAAAMAGLNWTVGGRVFTGQKWTASQLDPAHPTAPAFSRFLHATSALLDTPVDRLEPPTVSRYLKGQYQRIHFDARPDGDPTGLKEFLEAGGQRLVQIVVYCSTLDASQGGGTRFHHPLLGGLTVQPRQGDALVFFPAFSDGKFDERMAHSGEMVLEGQKWILNTWACQRRVPSAVTHLLPPATAPEVRVPAAAE